MSRTAYIRLFTIAAIWLAWELVARSGLVFKGVVPSSLQIIAAVAEQVVHAPFYGHLLRTGYEVLLGFAIGSAAAILVGTTMGLSLFCGRMLHPYVNILAPTPKIVFLPVLMILFGVDVGSKIAVAALSAFFPVVVATFDGAREVPQVLVRVARSFRVSTLQLALKIYLPSMLPPITTGMRLGLGVAIIGTLLAEIKLSNKGLGYLAIQYYEGFHIPDLYAVLLVTFSLAVLANSLIGRLTTRIHRR